MKGRQAMSLLSRLWRPRADDSAAVRPLWHRVVEIARQKAWYAEGRAADTVTGRFDIVTLVLCLVLLRMERDEALITPSVRLTELFVTDMDGQLRQSGVGDLMVGKHMGKLMGVLGGRLGAFRSALAAPDHSALAAPDQSALAAPDHSALAAPDGGELSAAISRNVTLLDDADPAPVAAMARALAAQLAATPAEMLLAGEFSR
jgi:cytochrome b pre-mRNA-processing protein 3